jgi:hypothetical protein
MVPFVFAWSFDTYTDQDFDGTGKG